MTTTRDDPRFWDVRTLERRFRRGHLSRTEYEKQLKSLPDVADKCAPRDTDGDQADGPGANGVNG